MTVDWGDLKLNGMPALLRALEQFDKRQTQQEVQLKLLAYQVSQLEERAAELEFLWSEEIGRRLIPPGNGTEPAMPAEGEMELGAGWRIERR